MRLLLLPLLKMLSIFYVADRKKKGLTNF